VGHALKSGGLLHLKASHARVSQSGLKTDGGAMAVDARDTITGVATGSSSRWTDRCDGRRRTLLPLACRFLCIKGCDYLSLL
jgi:hypothetical protein